MTVSRHGVKRAKRASSSVKDKRQPNENLSFGR
jgi:hypothetical protein